MSVRAKELIGSVAGWVIVLGVLGGILLVPALCGLGLVVYGNHWDVAHPWLRRAGGFGMALVLVIVVALPTAALARSYGRTWRLRLRGVTATARVSRVYESPGSEAGDAPTIHAVADIDGRTVDVVVSAKHRPAVGDPIGVRYLPRDPTNAHGISSTVWTVLVGAVVEVIVVAMLLSLLLTVGLLVWALVAVTGT